MGDSEPFFDNLADPAIGLEDGESSFEVDGTAFPAQEIPVSSPVVQVLMVALMGTLGDAILRRHSSHRHDRAE